MKDHFERLARYNRWANQQMYGVVSKLSAEDFLAPRSGFFPSIAKTLNHLVVTDRIWLGRLIGDPSTHQRLDEMPYQRFDDLAAAREVEDRRIVDFVAALTPARIEATFHYKNMAGQPQAWPMAAVLTHIFNHQAHHRGQAHAMLASTPVPPPPMDLVYFYTVDKAQ
ncbi:MAG TPA: DinB family protein [Candidatus Cybelea sp.]|nr:DinB family protein [Candidatus Cybelea sp.]